MRLLPFLAVTACIDGPGVDPYKNDPGTTDDLPTTTTTTENPVTVWSEEREFTLRIQDTRPPELNLAMTKDEVAELLGTVAEDVLLMELDSEPLLTSALTSIKSACGTAWQNDNPDPQHNCDLTPLGQTFIGSADGTWRSSAEYAMVRILTMTPANSDVVGTSIAGLQGVADFLGIGGGFAEILADSLHLARTDEFLSTPQVVKSLQYNVLRTHPLMNGDDLIPVTLADALSDMATMSTTFGPSGNHPGIIDPSVPAYGQILTDDFEMRISTTSNLRVLDGLDLSIGKDFITVVDDQIGPTFDDPAEFDFNDPTKFSMSGIEANPTVDLRIAMFENPSWVPACTGQACVANDPWNPVGAGTVWTIDPWEVEYIIAGAGYDQWIDLYHSQSYYLLFFIWVADVDIGQNGNPGGWSDFSVLLDIGNPPADQYVWELVNEVAQRNLHNNGYYSFPEGQANVAFTLEDIDVGITAEEIEDAVRPVLQDQAADLAEWLLGNYHENSGPVDLFYRRSSDGTPTLFFISDDDHEPDAPYGWVNPGFFADADLTYKVSATDLPGVDDSAHEKWVPPVGESVVFVSDDLGTVYRLRVFVPESGDRDEITVLLSDGS